MSILDTRTNAVQNAGSFWTSSMKGEQLDIFRRLVRSRDMVNAWTLFDKMTAKFSTEDYQLVNWETFSFKDSDVTFIDVLWDERYQNYSVANKTAILPRKKVSTIEELTTLVYPEAQDKIVSIETGEFLLFPVGNIQTDWFEFYSLEPIYAISIGAGFIPTVIRAATGFLTCGNDFEYHSGVLYFREDPFLLFTDKRITCVAAYRINENPFCYPQSVDTTPVTGKHISEYLREGQSAKLLERALYEVAGLKILDKDFTVRYHEETSEGTLYGSDDDLLLIDYPHERLVLGNKYLKNTTIGHSIRVLCHRTAGEHWWSQVTNVEGVSLDGYAPFPSLIVPNSQVIFECIDSVFVKINIAGDAAAVDAWNDYRQVQEASSPISLSTYLIDRFNLTPTDTDRIQGLELLFGVFYKYNGIYIQLDKSALSQKQIENVSEFARHNAPSNAIIFIS